MTEPIVQRFVDFLADAPTPFHAVHETVTRLEAVGFEKLDLGVLPGPLAPGDRRFVCDSGSIFAFQVGSRPVVETGFRMIAAHTDSPNLRLKPRPYLRSHGYVRLGVEVYGGAIVPTWTDRDLGIAGRIVLADGSGRRSVLVDLREPLCRIANLAIHLNREVNTKGLKLNAQTELPALFSLDRDDDPDPLRTKLSAALDVDPEDILTWDLSLYDLARPCVAGAHGEFVHSARLDNLASCHAGLEALLAAVQEPDPANTCVLALFDHEEIGSQTVRGANSRVLDNVLRRILRHASPQAPGTFSRALTHSWLISADMAHGVHPAWPDRHDPEHMPRINSGPAIKQNANKRYTTEGESGAMWIQLCRRAEVPIQFYVHRADLRCGSTVGPMLAARLGVRAIDVGNPMLSMHSARELCGSEDHPLMVRALKRFFTDAEI